MTPRRVIVAFVLSIVVLSLVVAAPGSPLRPVAPEGYERIAPMVAVSTTLGLGRVPQELLSALTLFSLLACSGTLLLALKHARLGQVSMRSALGVAMALQVLTLALPLLISRDVYSYAIYGRIASVYHLNPYTAAPIHFGDDLVFPFVAKKWIKTPPVYGPVFTAVVAFVTRIAPSVNGLVFAFKTLAVSASLLTLAMLGRHVRRVDESRAAFAVMLFGWTPAVVIHSVASGHNDLLVGLSILVALALLEKNHEYLATAALTVGTLVKVAAAFPLSILLVTSLARRPPRERWRAAAQHLLVGLGISVAFVVPYWQTQDPSFGLIELAGHTTWLGPSGLLAEAAAFCVSRAGAPAFGPLASKIVRTAFLLTFLIALVAIAVAMSRRGDLSPKKQGAAWGRALLLLTLTGPVLQPWYIVWTLPTAYALPRPPRVALVAVSTLLGLSVLIAEPLHAPGIFGGLIDSTHWIITAGCAWALIHVLADLRRWVRECLGPRASAE